jgi:enoyl-CoA hydratase
VENVRVEHTGHVAVVTLDRPPVNALDFQTFNEIADVFDALGLDRTVSVAVLTGSGDRAFCGGVDLADSPRRHRPDGRTEPGAPQGSPLDQLDAGRVVRRCFWSIYDCAVPVIAAVNAAAVGAGVALAGSCDLIVASEHARFALTEINVGVLGGVKHAQRLLGPFKSKRMFLTGEWVPATEFHRLGAVEAVVPAADLLTTATALAETIASKSPIAVRLAKESANRVEHLPLQDGYRLEQDYTVRIRRFADSDEARVAYLDKREPDFRWE